LDTLRSVISFAAVAPGASQSLAHGLNFQTRDVVPDVFARRTTGSFSVTFTTTQVTVQNLGVDASDINVLCWAWHTIERAFGSTPLFTLAGTPFELGNNGGAAQAAGQAITFCGGVGTLDIYVDATNGNDANTGLVGDPLQTIGAVYDKFPWEIMGECTLQINLADNAGAVAVYETPQVKIGSNRAVTANYRIVGPSMIPITPATGPVAAVLDVAPATQVDNTGAPSGIGHRTRLNFTAAAPGWTVDDFQGAYVLITRGGNQVIAETPISKNTADEIFVDNEDVVADVLAGDTCTIVQEGASITGPAGDAGIFLITGFGAGDAGFVNPNTPSHFTRVELDGPYIAGVAGVAFDRCTITGVAPFGKGGAPKLSNCAITASLTWDACEFGFGDINPGESFLSTAGYVSFVMTGGGRFQMRGGSAQTTKNVSVWGSTLSESIGLQANASLGLFGAVQGVGLGASVGIRCGGRMSVCQVSGGDSTVITGPGGDLRVASGAAIAYGAGVGAFEEVAGFNGNFTRVLEGVAAAPTGDASIIYV